MQGCAPSPYKMDIDAGPILVRLQSQAPAPVQSEFAQFATLYDRKLWHELSVSLDKLFKDPNAKQMILPIYRELIVPLHKKISPDAFVRFSVLAAAQLNIGQEAASMLLALAEQYRGKATQAQLFVYARMSAAFYQLGLGQVTEAKAAIDECLPLVEAFTGVDPLFKASFYKVRSEYDKTKALFSAFYRDAFLYLACVNAEDLTADECKVLAHDLSVAAMLGDTVYNFGELLMHPILESVTSHPELKGLVSALAAFNSGNHAQFEQIVPVLSSNAILGPRMAFLRQKMCLMALVECVFVHLKSSRQIPFAAIADASHVPITEVEFLLMKALSLGLVKGAIDGLGLFFTVDWVQPRVLDRRQITELRSAIQAWKSRIARIGENLDLVKSLPDVMED